MKSNAGLARRKRPSARAGRDRLAMAAFVALFMSPMALAGSRPPLPQPRPAAALASDGKGSEHTGESSGATPEITPSPSPCRLALTDLVAIAPSVPAITGPGACAGDDLVRLEAVVLPDGSRVAVKPAATLRCKMASAVAEWIRSDLAPLAEGLGTRVSELDNLDSFECRGRNRVIKAKLSEHGRANALDVGGLRLANGRTIDLTDRAVERDLREKVLGSVCARFTTVLGPGSDGYHENHIHLDLIQRRNGYRICHWEIRDPVTAIGPLLPAERPAQASRHEMGEEDGKASAAVRERGAVSRAVSQAGSEAAMSAKVVPEPRKRPAAADAAAKVARDSPKSSASKHSTWRSVTHSAKRTRGSRNDLPPFLRLLFD
ncbi:MAG: extensin family protein [Nitrobacter sp.]|uniref:extensin-like domain-containing protein n=2 Tax=Nitrobacter TaxID=911 RepID=UPI000324AD07|nr:extensin family protein [Nitrobacter sp.]MCB1391719.1 extensin family protein [Nitrobacter sp.]MCV0384924.1 extensin family protein [Nitrobacter sp.]